MIFFFFFTKDDFDFQSIFVNLSVYILSTFFLSIVASTLPVPTGVLIPSFKVTKLYLLELHIPSFEVYTYLYLLEYLLYLPLRYILICANWSTYIFLQRIYLSVPTGVAYTFLQKFKIYTYLYLLKYL